MKLDKPITAIMTSKVVTVKPEQKLVDVKHLFEKTPFHHHLPVVSGKKLKGMISLVDFMRAIGNAGLNDDESVYQNITVKEIMTEKPMTLKPSTTIKKAAKELAKGDVHAFVIVERGEVRGIVSYVDIVRYLLRVLE